MPNLVHEDKSELMAFENKLTQVEFELTTSALRIRTCISAGFKLMTSAFEAVPKPNTQAGLLESDRRRLFVNLRTIGTTEGRKLVHIGHGR